MSTNNQARQGELSDEDSISVHSTVPSEPKDSYPLVGILAERRTKDGTEYLIKWEGYPDERCTWESEKNFQQDGTRAEWEQTQARIRTGLQQPFNVVALERRVEEWIAETKNRKARRRAKRFRLGLRLFKEQEEEEHRSLNQVAGHDLETPQVMARPRRRSRRFSGTNLSDFVDSDSNQPVSPSRKQVSRHATGVRREPQASNTVNDGSSDGTSEAEYSTEDSLMEDLHTKLCNESYEKIRKPPKGGGSIKSTENKADMYAKKSAASIAVAQAPISAHQKVLEASTATTGKASVAETQYLGKAGRGPAKLGLKSSTSSMRKGVTGAAVLKNWAAGLKPPKRAPNPSGSVTGDKASNFRNLSTKRKFEKAGRNEPAPDLDQLVFWSLKDGKTIKPENDSSAHHTPPARQVISSDVINARLMSAATDSLVGHVVGEGQSDSAAKEEDQLLWKPQARDNHACNVIGNQELQDGSTASRSRREHISHAGPSATSPSLPLISSLDQQRDNSQPHPTSSEPIKISSEPRHPPHGSLALVTPHPSLQGMLLEKLRPVLQDPDLHLNPGDDRRPDRSDLFGNFRVGPEPTMHAIGDVACRGLANPVKFLVLSIKKEPRAVHLWFQHMCTAEEYRKFFHRDAPIYYGAGYLIPFRQSEAGVKSVTESLLSLGAAGLFLRPNFSMLIIPPESESWRFVDQPFAHIARYNGLRFIVRAPITDPSAVHLRSLHFNTSMPEMDSGIDVNEVFRQRFGIEYSYLVPRLKEDSGQSFFLMYPDGYNEEQELLTIFLEANGASVYHASTSGAWEWFSSSVEVGTVLFHDTCTAIHLIPSFGRLLKKSINVFTVNLRSSPSTSVTRILPHGAALLLTDSLFLTRPQEALRLLVWFRSYTLKNKPPGTWKLVTRPRFRNWILKIIEERSEDDGRVFVEIYRQIWKILPIDMMDPSDDLNTPKSEANIIYSREIPGMDMGVGLSNQKRDSVKLARNDDILADWFAGWSRTKLQNLRRFYIVHGDTKAVEMRRTWKERWSYIMAGSVEEILSVHRIANWEINQKEHETAAMEKSKDQQ